MQHSFQTLVDYAYIGVGGKFGVTPGSIPPRWTVGQLAKELMGEYITQPGNFLDNWTESLTQVLGIIQTTINKYAGQLGELSRMTDLQNTTPEWDAWFAANKAV